MTRETISRLNKAIKVLLIVIALCLETKFYLLMTTDNVRTFSNAYNSQSTITKVYNDDLIWGLLMVCVMVLTIILICITNTIKEALGAVE